MYFMNQIVLIYTEAWQQTKYGIHKGSDWLEAEDFLHWYEYN